jgi:hypothetical protein
LILGRLGLLVCGLMLWLGLGKTASAQPAPAAGTFRFTSGLYMCSDNESSGPSYPDPKMSATPGARLTITRDAGASGRVLVDYIVTNYVYTDVFVTNISGTNILTGPDTNGNYTNFYFTNVVVGYLFQDFEYNQFVYLPWIYTVTNIAQTNINGTLIPPTPWTTNYVTNVYPGFACLNTTMRDTNGVTNIFCTNIWVTNIVPSAIDGTDYVSASGTLPFDDHQLSSDILVTVMPEQTPPVFLWPFTNYTTFRNRLVLGGILNVALDPLESTSIAAPVIGQTYIAGLNILDTRTTPPCPYQPACTNVGQIGTNIFNFERMTLRCTEDIGLAHVGVNRITLDPTQQAQITYRIDYRRSTRTPNGNNIFQESPPMAAPQPDQVFLQAGSEYAVPTGHDTYATNIDFQGVTSNLTWGAFDTQIQFIPIPISNDTLVEFNEDLMVELWPGTGPEVPSPYYTSYNPCVGYVHTCALTILFDNIIGGEQPAGALDRTHNMDNFAGTQPPYNQLPGANASVFSVKVQQDGKTVLGGEFTAVNTISRHRIARLNADGQLDTAFDPLDGLDATVNSLDLDSSGRILLGGAFTSVNRVPRVRVARLNNGGSLDTSFNPGLGANDLVWKV